MLACPEQDERSFDRRLVAAAGGVAHAGEETPAALGVADVRRRHAAARSSRRSAAAPRGQKRRPTPRLIAKPMATSSTRTSPTLQPTGWMRLKSTKRTTVKPAWPAANEIARGA